MTDKITSDVSTLTPAQAAAAQLRADLNKARPYADGTIVAFTSVATNGDHFHYAGVFAGGRWHFTTAGNSYFPATALPGEFTALLMKHGHRIIDLRIATDFEPVELG